MAGESNRSPELRFDSLPAILVGESLVATYKLYESSTEPFELSFSVHEKEKMIDRKNEQLRLLGHEATYDSLTGLMLRKPWMQSVQNRMDQGKHFGIALFDIDRFREVNNRFGHGRGDLLLQAFGEHMRNVFQRRTDAVGARLGGDEFGAAFDMEEDGNRAEGGQEARFEREKNYINGATEEFVALQPDEILSLPFSISVVFGLWQPGMIMDAEKFRVEIDKILYKQKRVHIAERMRKLAENHPNVSFT